MIRAYHFVGATLRDGSAIPPDGAWLELTPPFRMCERGLHASRHPFDALHYAPGATLCLVDCDGIAEEQSDKLVCARRRIVARFDATDMLWGMSRWSALQVIHLWDAPPVVREFLETGNESLRDAAWAAARAAAWAAEGDAAWAAARAAARAAEGDAAWAAAWAAARAAERAAAWAAEGDAQKTMFGDAVYTEFIAIGVEP